MKKLRIYKLIQTVVLFIAAAGVFITGLCLGDSPDTEIFLQAFFWSLLALSFVCVLIDLRFFSNIDNGSYQLRMTAYVDPLTGVMNRTGMDLLLSRLREQGQLPDLGCVSFQLTNLFDVNDQQGHDAGDRLVRRFGSLLSAAFTEHGYVCRNSAAIFFAVVANCDEERLSALQRKVQEIVDDNNSVPGNPQVSFTMGSAANVVEGFTSASDLLSKAYKRATGGT